MHTLAHALTVRPHPPHPRSESVQMDVYQSKCGVVVEDFRRSNGMCARLLCTCIAACVVCKGHSGQRHVFIRGGGKREGQPLAFLSGAFCFIQGMANHAGLGGSSDSHRLSSKQPRFSGLGGDVGPRNDGFTSFSPLHSSCCGLFTIRKYL